MDQPDRATATDAAAASRGSQRSAGRPVSPHRSILSIIVMTAIGSPVAGFLWIGRPWLALATFLLAIAYVPLVMATGLPFLAIPLPWWLTLAIGTALTVAVVIAVRRTARPAMARWPWYGILIAVFAVWLSMDAISSIVAYREFSIPSASMQPALEPGDILISASHAYGFTSRNAALTEGMTPIRRQSLPVQRGDIVVFLLPSDPSVPYVKRVVGMPGERIAIRSGVLHIEGAPVDLVDVPLDDAADYDGARLQQETLPNGVSYRVLDAVENSRGDDTPEVLVPANHYFVLGDNRDNSSDSRFLVGFVPADNLLGRIERIQNNRNGKPFFDRQYLRTAP